MKYNNEARKAKSNDSKQKIMECATALINEKGFDNVTVLEITKEAKVSKGAFYIHFKSKEDLLEQQINTLYGPLKLSNEESKRKRLKHYLDNSVKIIKENGLRMAQDWFSHAVKGSYFGNSKLAYDLEAVNEIVGDASLSDEIVSVYYGALNLWCITNGKSEPSTIIDEYLNEIKERLES